MTSPNRSQYSCDWEETQNKNYSKLFDNRLQALIQICLFPIKKTIDRIKAMPYLFLSDNMFHLKTKICQRLNKLVLSE